MATSKVIRVHVHIHDAVIDVCCGQGEQQARWLANVAVARYDAVNSKGFLKLGGPKRIFKPSIQVDVPFHLKIKDIFEDGDHIVVETIFDDEKFASPVDV